MILFKDSIDETVSSLLFTHFFSRIVVENVRVPTVRWATGSVKLVEAVIFRYFIEETYV